MKDIEMAIADGMSLLSIDLYRLYVFVSVTALYFQLIKSFILSIWILFVAFLVEISLYYL